ncbi:hypothetical protein ACQEV4_24905 [Streptomyces shenzhenensis]|uniref:hypothetical protein n=1 Tax=Streptomyces shenzhenensis TaxID=943815 RepID=UPI003D8A8202
MRNTELLVRWRENTVLRRQLAGPVRYEPGDRFWFAALWDCTTHRRTGRPPTTAVIKELTIPAARITTSSFAERGNSAVQFRMRGACECAMIVRAVVVLSRGCGAGVYVDAAEGIAADPGADRGGGRAVSRKGSLVVIRVNDRRAEVFADEPFAGDLTDPQAAATGVRAIDRTYALGAEFTATGFDTGVLSKFSTRLTGHGLERGPSTGSTRAALEALAARLPAGQPDRRHKDRRLSLRYASTVGPCRRRRPHATGSRWCSARTVLPCTGPTGPSTTPV